MNEPRGYVDSEYLRIAGDFFGRLKERTYACMQIKVGDKVLDVGCGPGTDTIPLAQLVGPTGEVFGVDYDSEMIVEANECAKQAGTQMWVKHKQADATSLPFITDYFDASRSERLFQHLSNPALALSEMRRVTKPGGWIVVLDTDWGSGGIDTSEIDIERRLLRFHAEHMHNNGFAGRQLYRLFKIHGFQDISYEVFPMVITNYNFLRQIIRMDELERTALAERIVSEDELKRIQDNLEQGDANGTLFSYANVTLMAGKKAG